MDIQFLGAAREVTGSCFLIRCAGARVLVDCGLIQGTPREESRNREPFPFEPRQLHAVVLTHAHLDHSGRLPMLVNAGFRGPIYTHPATADLCRILLKDAAYLSEKDAEWENRKRRRKWLAEVTPLYTMEQAEQAMEQVTALPYGEQREVAPGVSVVLRDAGHILGSAVVAMTLEEGKARRTIAFSGDLGHRGAPILRDPQPLGAADLVVLESTYGDRDHRPWEATWNELAEVLDEAQRKRGNILIPVFAVGRTQELLYMFGREAERWGVDRWTLFLDSPMAIEATEVYARHWRIYDAEARAVHQTAGNPFVLPNLHFSRTTEQSMAINQVRSGAIIMAGSGMCTGGRIKHHFKHQIWNPHCHVLIVGFQARGTPGRALVDGARHIRLWGETVRVGAKIHTIGGLSAHAGQRGLLDWYRTFPDAPPVALVHGEPGAMDTLAERLSREQGARVHLPELGQRLNLLRDLRSSPR